MNYTIKSIRRAVIGVVALLVLAMSVIIYSFLREVPIPTDGRLSGGAKQIKEGFVSVAVIPVSGHQAILVDCGNDLRATAILEGLSRMGLERSDVRAILLTHAHPDHVSGCGVFDCAKVYAMAAERPLIEHLSRPIHISQYLEDRDLLQIGNVAVTAYLVPGHTDGSAAYLAAGTLYLGDSAEAARDGSLLPAKHFVSKNVVQNRASLVRLAEELRPQAEEIQFIEFAHSGPLMGLTPLLSFAAKSKIPK